MKQKSKFAKIMHVCAFGSCLLFGCATTLYYVFPQGFFLSLAITFGTFGYHFVMRLAVGWLIPKLFRTRLNPQGFWFRKRSFEKSLYRFLKVRRWKGKFPSYNPQEFSFSCHSIRDIIQNSCIAELVHLWIMVLSFLPVAMSCLWGELTLFLATSILAAMFDGCFVIMQRYNRPRLIQYLQKTHRLEETP
jgi:hypothetical protein